MNKWRFPNNQCGPENGLDTSDMETFKKDPEGALAREICQNSIDAQINSDIATLVEFKLFEIEREAIPEIETLTKQVEKCYEYNKNSIKEEKPLRIIKNNINNKIIKCLRISDFNTTGLIGVSSNEKGKPYYNLIKGSGISNKQGTSGGSKGIGKFASFVASTTNTVFYSTKTVNSEIGYIGITRLCSAPIEDDDDELVTQGIGYYSSNDKNHPILEEFQIDKSFVRGENDFGTDLFIIGFNDRENWIADIVSKVLDSFMVAIVKNGFVVTVDDIIISKDTLYHVIYESTILESIINSIRKDIKAQYELLTSEDTLQKTFDIEGKGNITVYVKSYNSQNSSNATKRCIMVRYPYMKIKHSTGHSYLPYSAMCVIDDSELNEKLRIIENPQHTDWEIKRLNDFPIEKKETRLLKKNMDDTITNYIHEVLSHINSDVTDVEGAGEYLPSQDDGEEITGAEKQLVEGITISNLKPSSNTVPKTIKIGEQDESYDPSTGELVDGEPEGRERTDRNNDANPNPNKSEPKDEIDKEVIDGNKPILHRTQLSGIKFKTILANRDYAEYDVIFTSLYDVDFCEMSIKQCGESSDKYPVNIVQATINGEKCDVHNGKVSGFPIVKGEKYKITCRTDIQEVFSSEVVLNACR